jgi:hypothetical protein
MSDPIRINDYDMVKLEEYNGKFSLVLGYEAKDGSFKVKWSKQEFGKGNEKNVPVKVPLGDKPSAVMVLGMWLRELDGGERAQDGEENAPF